MSTKAQIIANRSNSQKSTGPRSRQGKAVVSQNAVKHGLFALQAVIKGENRADFDLYRDEMLAELAPVGPMESMLAERVVSLSWRIKRVERMQNQAIDVMIERDEQPSPLAKLAQSLLPKGQRQLSADASGSNGELVLGRVAIKDYSNSRVLDRLLMYERRIENSMFKTMAELLRLRLMRELEEANADDEEFRVDTCPPQDDKVNDAKQRQSPAFGRKSEALNPKSETILQNKANFIGAQMGASSFVGENYENKSSPGLRENKPKQSQYKDRRQMSEDGRQTTDDRRQKADGVIV